jgi:hypothetical protein
MVEYVPDLVFSIHCFTDWPSSNDQEKQKEDGEEETAVDQVAQQCRIDQLWVL